MSITTYSELQTALANWLHHSSLTDRIPEFIALAEAKINDEVRIKEMQARDDTLTASTSSRWVTLPTDFNRPMQLEMTYSSQIWFPEYVINQMMKNHRLTTDGQPAYYTVWGSELGFNRTPDYAYAMELYYWKKVTALSDANPTNAVLTYYPNIYLYGALCAAEPYVVNDARVALWKTYYADAVESANDNAKMGVVPASPRMRSTSVVL